MNVSFFAGMFATWLLGFTSFRVCVIDKRMVWAWAQQVCGKICGMRRPGSLGFEGRYSVEQLQQLDGYVKKLSWWRVLAACVFTPLPSLAVSLLKEVPPLAPPDAGVYANWVFFLRSWAVLALINVATLAQLVQGAPWLKMGTRLILWLALLASTVSIALIFVSSLLFVFPLPFGLLYVAIPDVSTLGAAIIWISRPQVRANPSLWIDVKRQLTVFLCQVALTGIYPLYIYGFLSLEGVDQTLFVVMLPFIKTIAKNVISRVVADRNELRPESVIFIVEVFNAIYVSNALQNSSSLTTLTTLIVLDLVHFWVSMLDVVKLLNEVKSFMVRIPRSHPSAGMNFLQVTMLLLNHETELLKSSRGKLANTANRSKPYRRNRVECWIDGQEEHETSFVVNFQSNPAWNYWRRTWKTSLGARIFPIPALLQNDKVAEMTGSAQCFELDAVFSREERAGFIQKSMRVLFITEYLVLVEYAEVVLPIIYNLHRMVLFHMHNSAYYPSLSRLTRQEMFASLFGGIAYSSFELISLILALMILKYKLGFSALPQLGFVLETQAELVQAKLTSLVVYVIQVPLAHHGADFSFNFAWLHL